MLNERDERGHPFPVLGEKHAVSPLSMILAVNYSVNALYQVKDVPAILVCRKFFVFVFVLRMDIAFCEMLFLHQLV